MKKDASQLVDEFFEQYRLRQYKKGQILILSGDGTDYIYYLLKGRVKQYDVSYRGDEVVINVFKPPAYFPMSLALSGGANPYIFEAETDLELKQAPAREVVEFLKSQPEVAFDLLTRVYRGLDGLQEKLAHLMKGSAKERLMFEILINAKRFGQKLENGGWQSDINESELAGRAGLSRETVSREIQKLAKSGLIKFKSGRLVIPRPKIFEKTIREIS